MKAIVTRTRNKNIKALQVMLKQDGLYLVRVHQSHIVKLTNVPREKPIEQALKEYSSFAEDQQ